ncbi:hypothetical protein F2P81_019740 [Scophthalmus maximus]|uniref:RecA family profile 1 domain-containing protein n=1 Tax=Scophthalmus maximus TaxID=52904 RepID=A0A6A4S2S4_SCOMX|nr:hypothetical protein F2P81_019740 [Scophthalmus maximus]
MAAVLQRGPAVAGLRPQREVEEEEDGPCDRGEVVELYGSEGTGKTELLYHLLCRCVLPNAAGGLEADVVFVDTDYSLDMLRLVSIMESRLNAALSTSAASDEEACRSCLSRLLVVHCSSSSQLLLTLHFLENSFSSRPGLALLLIDSISAFYWPDRCEGGANLAKQEEKLSKCSELLGRLLRRPVVVSETGQMRTQHQGYCVLSEDFMVPRVESMSSTDEVPEMCPLICPVVVWVSGVRTFSPGPRGSSPGPIGVPVRVISGVQSGSSSWIQSGTSGLMTEPLHRSRCDQIPPRGQTLFTTQTNERSVTQTWMKLLTSDRHAGGTSPLTGMQSINRVR